MNTLWLLHFARRISVRNRCWRHISDFRIPETRVVSPWDGIIKPRTGAKLSPHSFTIKLGIPSEPVESLELSF